MKIAIIGNFNTITFAEELDSKFVNIDIVMGDSRFWLEEIENPADELKTVDVIILAVDYECFIPELYEYSYGEQNKNITNLISEKLSLLFKKLKKFRELSQASIVLFSPVPIAYSSLGFIDRSVKESKNDLFHYMQREFNKLCQNMHNLYIIDLELLTLRNGYNNSIDIELYIKTGCRFNNALIRDLCEETYSIIYQLNHDPLKCLVLDLDNTLWGGIVGEEGVGNVKLAREGDGAQYYIFQKEIEALYKRGIILTVASKNNTCDAMTVMENHPDMVIKPNMISCFRINWENKVQNIIEIAKELNIGLSSMLFIDDNPVERGFVKAALPEVEVLELTDNAYEYRNILCKCFRLNPLMITKEDIKKNQYYAQNRMRYDLKAISNNLEEYLKNISISVEIDLVNEANINRIAQLFSKTNQFNLTTKRYTATELKNITEEKDNYLFALSSSDKFGDEGVVSAVILKGNKIDSFLMSCRVFGKKIELAFLFYLLKFSKDNGYKSILGNHICTERNSMTWSFYKDAGFSVIREDSESGEYEFDLTNPLPEIPSWINLNLSKQLKNQ